MITYSSNVFKLVLFISKHLKKKRKTQFIFLSILIFISSFFEVLTLGAIIPFISLLINPHILSDTSFFIFLDNILNIKNKFEIKLFILSLFVFLVVCSGILRLLLSVATMNFSRRIGQDLSEKVFSNILYQEYNFHIDNTSSEIISQLLQKVLIVTRTFQASLIILSSFLIALSILITFLVINFYIAIIALTIIIVLYLVAVLIVKKRYLNNSKLIAIKQTNVVNIIQESLGSIRDIIIGGKQEIYKNIYVSENENLQKANTQNDIYNQSPKYIIEIIGIISITIFIIFLSYSSNGLVPALPMLGVIALVAQRLLPISQQIYASWSVLASSYASLIDVNEFLNLKTTKISTEPKSKMKFSKHIELKNINFNYKGSKVLIFNNLHLKILKGSRIGICGASGSGKSTLIDLISGLLIPIEGEILIDGIKINKENALQWQKNISYVPQSLFLLNSSIKENITVYHEIVEQDDSQIYRVLKEAQLLKFVESLPDGINTKIGEKGVKLSGGQKQRLGIARALYKNSSVLIFDESTNALDPETEAKMISEIYSLNKEITIIFVTHKKDLLDKCDFLVEVINGNLKVLNNKSN
jgi:ABC-type bacteriocin/lantibiotic exporter with double-glycine peptidase domain